MLPKATHRISIELRVGADNGNLFHAGLGNDEQVEWIPVMKWEGNERGKMGIGGKEPLEVIAKHVLGKKALIRTADIKLLEAHFNRNFPWRGGAD